MSEFHNIAQEKIVLTTLIRNYPYAIVYKDANFNTVYVNDLFCKHFAISAPSVVIGTSCIEFLSPENAQLILDLEKRVKQELLPLDFKLQDYAGKHEKTFRIIMTPVIEKGMFNGVIYTINDITIEENIKKRLKIKHSQLKALLENLPLIVYLKDKSRKYITGSKVARRFVKDSYDESSNIYIDLSKDQSVIEEEDKKILTSCESIFVEKEIFDAEGGKHWYRVRKVPIRGDDDNVSGIVTIVKNIDARRRLEAQRETFVASLGHDLKNPTLAQIRAIELLLKGAFGEIPEEQKEILEMVLDSCKYMNAMLTSLLATYRNELGAVKLANEEFSLLNLVNECTEEMIYLAKDKNVKISLSKDCKKETIFGDKIQIKRVIMNLLSNGIKYAYANTTLKVKIYNEEDKTCFKFENSSPYISQEKQETIFAQYVSFAEAHKELGIGLGLYASKKIVEAHGGEIYVKSYEDDRNEFGFKIPNLANCATERTVLF